MTIEALRQRGRWLRRITTLVFAALALGLTLDAAMTMRSADPAAALLFMLAFRAPVPFYLVALWMIRLAFGQVARGVLFDEVMSQLLGRLGVWLALGAAATVFATPNLLRLLYGPRHGAFASFDPAAITLGVVGLMLAILARLLARAAAMRAELDEIL